MPEQALYARKLTSEAHATGANVSAGHILAGASIHTWVGFTLVVVDVAVFTAPARVAQAFIANRKKTLGKRYVKISLPGVCYTISFDCKFSIEYF